MWSFTSMTSICLSCMAIGGCKSYRTTFSK